MREERVQYMHAVELLSFFLIAYNALAYEIQQFAKLFYVLSAKLLKISFHFEIFNNRLKLLTPTLRETPLRQF